MSETPVSNKPSKKEGGGRTLMTIAAVAATAVVTFGVTALLINIFDKKEEGKSPYAQVVEIGKDEIDPAVWGKNFPVQYADYLKTKDFVVSDHGGVLEKREATPEDPRTEIASSKIEEDPRLKIMWAGYPFSVDYRHARGHAYMGIDQNYTQRVQQFKQPGACLNCHTGGLEQITEKLGNGDKAAGWAAMNKMPYAEAASNVEHDNVTCSDCHDPETMKLRITRPALVNAMKSMKAAEGVADYDVNADATHDEMRSLVCAQCHVEYFFKGDEKTVTFPWDKGLDIDDAFAYYKEAGYADFTNKLTEAKVTKAQHPEYEIYSQGIHAKNGVTCADCHMSYKRDGAAKVTNHDITTPMADPNASCGTCHSVSDDELRRRVKDIQDTFISSRDRSFDALTALIADIQTAMTNGTPAEQIDLARKFQDKASFYVDYVYSENSYGFHAPDYEQRVLNQALDAARSGQLALKGVPEAQLQPSEISVANQNEAEGAPADAASGQ